MTNITFVISKPSIAGWACLLLLLSFTAIYDVQAQSTIAVKGDVVYTMAGDAIEDGVVLIRNGKIAEVGRSGRVQIPGDAPIFEGAVVTPGFVDAHSVIGLAGWLNYNHDQDQLDKSNVIQPHLRAIDAYNAREPLVEFARKFGVTTVHSGHGPGALVSGQTLIAKTVGETVEEAVVNPAFGLAMTLGPSVSGNFTSPGTRSKGIAMLREKFHAAKTYKAKRDTTDADKFETKLEMDALADVLEGKMPAMITAQASTEIMSAIRLADEFGFKLILDGGAEAYLLTDVLLEKEVSVILHPTMKRAGGEAKNLTFESAALLHEAGVPFVFQTGYEGYVPKTRVLLFEAAIAVAYGLDFNAGLRKITIEPAELLGIADRVGSLEVGKDADVVVFDGDPFEYRTHACTVIVDGSVVSDECN